MVENFHDQHVPSFIWSIFTSAKGCTHLIKTTWIFFAVSAEKLSNSMYSFLYYRLAIEWLTNTSTRQPKNVFAALFLEASSILTRGLCHQIEF